MLKVLATILIVSMMFTSCSEKGSVGEKSNNLLLERLIKMPTYDAQYHILIPSLDSSFIDTLEVGVAALNKNRFDFLLKSQFQTSATDFNLVYVLHSFDSDSAVSVVTSTLMYDVDGDSVQGYTINGREFCESKSYQINENLYNVIKVPIKLSAAASSPNQWNYYAMEFGLLAIENQQIFRTLTTSYSNQNHYLMSELIAQLLRDTSFYFESTRIADTVEIRKQ